MADRVRRERVFAYVLRFGKDAVRVTVIDVAIEADVVGVLVMYNRCAFCLSVVDVEDGRQFLVLDVDQPQRALGRVPVYGSHRRHFVADEAHLIGRQSRLVLEFGHQSPVAVANRGHVLAGDHALDTGERPGA